MSNVEKKKQLLLDNNRRVKKHFNQNFYNKVYS